MAEATRFKDLQAEFKNVSEQVKHHDSVIDEGFKSMSELVKQNELKIDRMEANNNARLDRIEAAIEAMVRTPNARVDKLEATYAGMSKELESQQRNSERLSQLVFSGGTTHERGSYSGGNQTQPYYAKQVKIDFPRFNGTDPQNWIFRAEQYFAYYDTPDPHRLVLAAINMEGDVIPWFQLLQKTKVIYNWASLTKALEEEFGPSLLDQPRAKLFKLTQSNSVEDYCRQFMTLANRTEGVLDDALLDCFTGGLKPEIRREVVARRPPNLQKAIEIAKLFDHPDPVAVPKFRNSVSSSGVSTKIVGHSVGGNLYKNSAPPLLPTPSTKPTAPIKRMTSAEMMIRREKGLCYTCDAKFTPGHRCLNKQYMVIECEGDEGHDEEVDSVLPIDSAEDKQDEPLSIHHLSLHAYRGSPGKATIRFIGMMGGIEVQILLDGGSSDSFIHPRIAKHLGLPVEPVKNVRVMVGDGSAMKGEGVVREVVIQVQGQQLNFPAFVLPIAGSDIVIGASWLATLGPHVANYAIGDAYIKFYNNDDFVTLRGTNQRVVQRVEFHQLQRLINTDAVGEMLLIAAGRHGRKGS